MDLTKLSDDDLKALHANDYSQLSDEGLKHLSGGSSPEQPGVLSQIGDAALSGLGKVVNFVDSYTGAPVRAGVGKLQSGGTLSDAAQAYKNQFGEDASLAPSGKEIAQKIGVPDSALSGLVPGAFNETGEGWKLQKGGIADITSSGVAGLGVDLATDPTSYIPLGAVAKGIGKITAAAKPSVIKGMARAGEAFTGAPAREFETYMKHMPEVNQSIAKYGGDTSVAADEVRKRFMGDIQKTRRGANEEIEKAIMAADPDKHFIELGPVLEAMEVEKLKINSTLKPEAIAEIDEIIAKVRSLSDSNRVDIRNGMDLKQWLQDIAEGEYRKDGQIFTPGKELARAAKSGAFHARAGLNQISPEIAAANKKLSLLRTIEKRINKNVIGEGRPEAALLSAGGSNLRNRQMLESLGEMTGTNMVEEAEKLAAMRRFAKPEILPVDTTGKTATRLAVAYALGGKPAMVATSPMAWKYGLNAGQKIAEAAPMVGKAMQSPLAKPVQLGAMEAGRQKSLMDRVSQAPNGQKFLGVLQSAEQKGPEAVSTVNFILQQTDPEYQRIMEETGQ